MKSWKTPTADLVEKALASVKKETDRQYFFSRLKNPYWIDPLVKRGFFQYPPGLKHLPDGYVQYPFWPEFQYLKNIAREVPEQTIGVILGIPKTDNPRIYDDVIEIALNLDAALSVKLLPKILEYAQGDYLFLAHHFGELLEYWASNGKTGEALEVMKELVFFSKDPKSEEKQAQRRADPEAHGTLLEPSPRFGAWEYSEILEKGVRPLAEREPYQTAQILIDAMSAVLRLRIHQSDWDEGYTDDHSSIWCERLTEPTRNYEDTKAGLVHILTYACEQVFLKDPAAVAVLDQALRNQRWDIFKRIRQHLYAENPNEHTKPWIREMILAHGDYGKWEYRFEFQRMIRCACERFGPELLSEEERENIFKAIQDGPSKEEYRQWMGDKYSEEGFEGRKHYFHSRQFAPFTTVLFAPFKEYYQELVASEAKPVTDNDYAPFKSEGVKNGEQRSPVPLEELKRMSDEDLLTLVNEWDAAHHDPEKWWVDINIAALACEFQTLFSTIILFDKDRLKFWFDNLVRVARPIYVEKMVLVAHERVKSKNFDQLEIWFDLCGWILSHPDMDKAKALRGGDETKENPDWRSARRAVGDFVGMCLEKDVDVPISTRLRLAKILETLCTDFDRRLDNDEPVLLNRDDQLTEAINNTRSRALEDLIDFGFWARRQLHDDQAAVSEVFSILEKRMGSGRPLTLPEHALLGLHFGRIFMLDAAWAKGHKDWLFPQDNLRVWMEAFSLFLRHSRPYEPLFLVVRDDIEFALENIPQDKAANNKWKTLVDSLGDHLFTYYLWGIFPLTGKESLLGRFYEQTKYDDGRWAHLFDRVGRNLRNSGKHLDEVLKTKVVEFFDWRREQKNPAEMKEFTFWLDAECLDAEWRLKAFSRTLDVSKADDVKTSICLGTLRKLLDEYPDLVVECFAKLTDSASKDKSFYIQPDKAKPILQMGLKSRNDIVRKNAERARENLLRAGRFAFLDVDDLPD